MTSNNPPRMKTVDILILSYIIQTHLSFHYYPYCVHKTLSCYNECLSIKNNVNLD